MSLSSFVRSQLENASRSTGEPQAQESAPVYSNGNSMGRAFPRTSQAKVLIAIRCDFFLFVVSIRTLLRDNDSFDVAWLPIFGCWLLV